MWATLNERPVIQRHVAKKGSSYQRRGQDFQWQKAIFSFNYFLVMLPIDFYGINFIKWTEEYILPYNAIQTIRIRTIHMVIDEMNFSRECS